jgi:hypothetical protein
MPDVNFIPGLQLNEMFYHEAVKPILAQHFPGLAYSAALIGYGSDVLGYDTPTSMDHNWGPRLLLFLSPQDAEQMRESIRACLSQQLPLTFRGFSVNYSQPNAEDGGTQWMHAAQAGPVNHLVVVRTQRGFFQSALGIDPYDAIDPVDWLTIPEEALLEVTRGQVYHDGLNELEAFRAKFAYYPRDVWLYRMAAQWQRLSQEEPFVGRCGDVGDDIGSRIIASRLVRDLMRLAFLIERAYAPYSKWLGTAFARLDCADKLTPILHDVLIAPDWQARETHLCDAYIMLAEMHNGLGITAQVDPKIVNFHQRPYHVLFAARFAHALKAVIVDTSLKEMPLVGGIDQFSDSTDFIDNPRLARRTKTLYAMEQKQ